MKSLKTLAMATLLAFAANGTDVFAALTVNTNLTGTSTSSNVMLECKVPVSIECKVPGYIECKVPSSIECKVPNGIECKVPPSIECKVPSGFYRTLLESGLNAEEAFVIAVESLECKVPPGLFYKLVDMGFSENKAALILESNPIHWTLDPMLESELKYTEMEATYIRLIDMGFSEEEAYQIAVESIRDADFAKESLLGR